MTKYFICDYASANWGKTSVLQRVISKLGKPIEPMISDGIDSFACFDVKGKMVSIVTQGDPGSKQAEWLRLAVQKGSDVIVCAARSKGQTIKNVYDELQEYYEIWFQNFNADKDSPFIDDMNNIMAEAIIKLIKKLCDQK